MQQVEITVLNWDTYNPKEVLVRMPHWFRLENSIIFDEKLHDLNAQARWMFVSTLCLSSRKRCSTYVVSLSYLCSISASKRTKDALKSLESLQNQGLIKFSLAMNWPLQDKTNNTIQTSKEVMATQPPKKRVVKPASLTSPNGSSTEKAASLIGVYVKAWQSRYGTKARPDVGGKSQGILKRLENNLGYEPLSQLLQAYCQMSDPWFDKKVHDLATFEQNLNRVALALDKGRNNPTERTWLDIALASEATNQLTTEVL